MINIQTHSLATSLLSSFPVDSHRQAQLIEDEVLHYDKTSYEVTEKVEDTRWDTQFHKRRKGWEKELCEQRSFSQQSLMGLHMIRDREKDKSRRTSFILPRFTNQVLQFSENCWQVYSTTLIQITSALAVTRLH